MKKIVLWSVFTVLYFLFSLTIISYIFTKQFQNPSFVKEALSSSGFYSKLANNASSIFSAEETGIKKDDFSKVISSAFSENYLQSNSEKIIDDGFLWLNEGKDFVINLDLKENKSKAFEVAAGIEDSSELQNIIANIPDNYKFEVGKDSKAPANLKELAKATKLSVAICIFLFLLTIVLLWKEPKTLSKKHGSALLMFGLPILVICLVDTYFLKDLMNLQLLNYFKANNLELGEILIEPINKVYLNTKNNFMIASVVTTIAGLVFMVTSFLLKEPEKSK